MLLGMALYKQGLFTDQIPSQTTKRVALITLSIGLVLVLCGVHINTQAQFNMQVSMFYGSLFNYVGSVFMAIGYLFGLVWLVQKKPF